MSEQPMNRHRPDARATVLVLTVGTLIAVATFAVGFALRLLGQTGVSDFISVLAVIALLATPVLALVSTALELRNIQRTSARLAVLVLFILGAATALALLVSR